MLIRPDIFLDVLPDDLQDKAAVAGEEAELWAEPLVRIP